MDFITQLISEYGLYAMFFIILLEYACFPVSSELVLPFCGAFASANHIRFLTLLLFSILGGLIGTGLCYIVGWFGGGAILSGIIRRFPKAEKGLLTANEKFKQYGAPAVCIGRVIPLIRTYIALVAGAARLSPLTYFVASAIGITVWNTLLIGFGFMLRENYQKAAEYYQRYKHNLLPVAAVCLFAFLLYLLRKRLTKKQIGSC